MARIFSSVDDGIYMYICTVWLPHWQPKREKINSNRLMQLGRRSGLLGACTVLQQPAGARGTSETDDDDVTSTSDFNSDLLRFH